MDESVIFAILFATTIDIQTGVILLLSTLATIYLAIKLVEKEIVLKTFFLLLLIFSFFKLVLSLESHDDLTVYLTSTGFGIFILIIMASSMKFEDDSSDFSKKV